MWWFREHRLLSSCGSIMPWGLLHPLDLCIWQLTSKGLCGLLGDRTGGETDHLSYCSGHTQPEGQAGKCTVAVCPVGKGNCWAYNSSLPRSAIPPFWNFLSFDFHGSILSSGFSHQILTACFQSPSRLLFLLSILLIPIFPSICLSVHFSSHYTILPGSFCKQPEHLSPSFWSYLHVNPASHLISPHPD